jgi:hypothetical protein
MKLSELKAGDIVHVYGFTCTGVGPHRVYVDGEGTPYIMCRNGKHLLDGQLGRDGDTLIGVEYE